MTEELDETSYRLLNVAQRIAARDQLITSLEVVLADLLRALEWVRDNKGAHHENIHQVVSDALTKFSESYFGKKRGLQ